MLIKVFKNYSKGLDVLFVTEYKTSERFATSG